MNTAMALIHMDRRTYELRMQVVLGSSSNPAPGRTLAQIYSHVGDYVGMQANRMAHRWGRGPTATSHRIEAFFGTGHQRMAKLDALESCPQLEEKCSKLLKYALPCETARTQVATFKCIITIATRYHGTRRLFLKSKHLRRAGNTEALISAVWARADDTQSREWDYYCQIAAACLSENRICPILEDISPQCLGSIDTESGDLSVIERLLIASEFSTSSIPDALAQRYLAGVLELPSFWQESGAIHVTVFTKILDCVIRVLHDLSLDSDSDEGTDGILFDHEGIDSLASAVLVGVLNWHRADARPQYWHRSITEIVRLLRLPRAEPLLPTSSALATGPDINNMIPDPAPDALDVLIMVNSNTEIPQTCSESDYISIGNIDEALGDPVQDLDFAPTIVYMEAVSMRTFQWTAISSAHRWSSSLRKKLQENEPESVKARTWITERFRGLLPRRNHHGEYTTSSETPTVNPSVHNHRFSTSGSSSRSSAHPVVDDSRDFGDSDVQASSGDQSSQNTPEPSPYPSPNVSPAPHCSDLPGVSDPSAGPVVLSEQNVDGPANLLAEGNTATIWALEDSGPPGGESAGSFPNPFGGSQTLFNVLSPNPNWDHGSPIVASDLEDVESGRPVDPHHEQDKINADTDANSVQSMSRRSQSSANEGFTEDYIDTSSATTGVPGQDVLHQTFEPFAPDYPPANTQQQQTREDPPHERPPPPSESGAVSVSSSLSALGGLGARGSGVMFGNVDAGLAGFASPPPGAHPQLNNSNLPPSTTMAVVASSSSSPPPPPLSTSVPAPVREPAWRAAVEPVWPTDPAWDASASGAAWPGADSILINNTHSAAPNTSARPPALVIGVSPRARARRLAEDPGTRVGEMSSDGLTSGRRSRGSGSHSPPASYSAAASVPRALSSHQFNPIASPPTRTRAPRRKPTHRDDDSDEEEDDFQPTTNSLVGGVDSRRETIRKQRIESEQRRRDELRDEYARLKDTHPRAGADTPSSGTTRGLNVLPSLSTRTGGFFANCNNFEVHSGQFTNVEGSMTQYSGNAAYSVNLGTRARGNAPRYATTGLHYAQPNGNPSYGYSQFPAPPNPQFQAPPNPQFQVPPNPQFQRPPKFQAPPNPQFQAPPNPQFQAPPNPQFQRPPKFQGPPNPQFQGPPNPQFQAPPNPQFQRQPYPPLQGPPNPQFHAPQYPQFQGLPPNNVHPHQAPNLGRPFSDYPAFVQNSQNSGRRLPDPRAVSPEGDLAAQINARRAAAGNPPFRNPPPLQSFATPEARWDFARTTRAPTWSSAQPPSHAMPIPIPNSSRRTSRYSDSRMPLSSSPEEADRTSWAPPSSTPMNQYPRVASTSQQPPMPPSARARQKSRKMRVYESDSSDSEGTAKPPRRKKSPRH